MPQTRSVGQVQPQITKPMKETRNNYDKSLKNKGTETVTDKTLLGR